MKAVVFTQHGGHDVLKYTDAPDPRPRADEILVRVRACSINHLDLWVRRGIPGVEIPMPHIPGSDVAGEVAATKALGAHQEIVHKQQKLHAEVKREPGKRGV